MAHIERLPDSNRTISLTLRAENSARPVSVHGGRSMLPETLLRDFVIELSHSATLGAAVQIIRKYCTRGLASPMGMMFVRRDGQPQLISQWRSKELSAGNWSTESIRKGPVARAFRTGTPVFWSKVRSDRNISRYLRGLTSGRQRCSFAFLPIINAGEPTTGVLALGFFHEGELAADLRRYLTRFAQSMSGFVGRARAYEEALAARFAAENTNRRQADLLSMISHELRNPMTPILNWAIVLSSGRLTVEKQSFAIEAIIRNVRALNYLIDDLFDVARISSGKLRLEAVRMSIQETAREALSAIQQAAENKKLRVTTDISEGIPAFFADPRRVRQVLVNLLNNAVKFTPEGGSIRLKVAKSAGQVECTVSDTGKGIAVRFLPFVFDRFRQENRAQKTKGAGLGLGLNIVREIVELHGGSVKAQSQGANRGATFTFRLPLRKRVGTSKTQLSRPLGEMEAKAS